MFLQNARSGAGYCGRARRRGAIAAMCALLIAIASAAQTPSETEIDSEAATMPVTPPARNWFVPIPVRGAGEAQPDATLNESTGGDKKPNAPDNVVPVRNVPAGDSNATQGDGQLVAQTEPKPGAVRAGVGSGDPRGANQFSQVEPRTRPGAAVPRVPQSPVPGTTGVAAIESRGDEGLVEVEPDAVEGAPQDRAVMLNYRDRELKVVIESIAEYLQINIDLDAQNVNAPVTLITNQPIPTENLMFVLESILASRGLQLVPTAGGTLYRITQIGEASEHFPFSLDQGPLPEGFETLTTRIIRLENRSAEEIAPLLEIVGSAGGLVNVDGQTNMLILTDTANGIRNMLDLISELDRPGFSDALEYFPLEYARAEIIAEQITSILTSEEGGISAPQQPGAAIVRQPPQITRGRTPAIPGQKPQAVVTAAQQTLRLIADERLNMLVVVASEPLMDQVRNIIDRLDTITMPDSNNMHVRRLLYANAEEVQAALAEMVGAAPPPAEGGGQGQPGGAVSTAVQTFEKDVSITLYDKTNSLLIIASPQDYRVLDSVISQIDVPTPQVYVKAIIMEVTINDRFQLSVESAGLTANDYFALNNVVNLANVLTNGPLSVAGPGLATGILDGTTEITVPDGAGGLATQTIPNIPLLLTALKTLTALDVLSEPSLTTEDNTEARITIGEEVPFITGRQSSLNQGAVQSSVFNQIQREEVGIKMLVTPQISEGDTVSLTLSVEVSQTVASNVGLDPNLVGPTVSLAIVENQMVVRNGSTAIMGGLISEAINRSRSQTPIFGDIPLLGWLFRAKNDNRSKRNLVVLVTPHIFKEGIDAERMTMEETRSWRDNSQDMLFERGLIKRTQKDYHWRNKHQPTRERTNRILGEE